MVLEMPALLNTFEASVAVGEGIGADYAQVVRIEAGALTVPIGVALPWFKSITGVPTLLAQNMAGMFKECDGSVISDPDSPINGQTLPNMNGSNLFVRGATTSGGTGGSATANATHVTNTTDTFGTTGGSERQFLNDHTNIDTVPPYINAVWIMRIK